MAIAYFKLTEAFPQIGGESSVKYVISFLHLIESKHLNEKENLCFSDDQQISDVTYFKWCSLKTLPFCRYPTQKEDSLQLHTRGC